MPLCAGQFEEGRPPAWSATVSCLWVWRTNKLNRYLVTMDCCVHCMIYCSAGCEHMEQIPLQFTKDNVAVKNCLPPPSHRLRMLAHYACYTRVSCSRACGCSWRWRKRRSSSFHKWLMELKSGALEGHGSILMVLFPRSCVWFWATVVTRGISLVQIYQSHHE